MPDPTSTHARAAGPRSRTRRLVQRTAPAAVAVLAMGALGACGGDEDPQVSQSPTSTTVTTAAPDDTAADEGSSDSATVDANTASVDEMAAAFDAAGVPNAERWAREVEEYRPYTDDGWAHLRQELSKYNIDDQTFQQITSTLTL